VTGQPLPQGQPEPVVLGRWFEDFVEGWLTGLSEGEEGDDEDDDGGVD